jgi:hypothetical protein
LVAIRRKDGHRVATQRLGPVYPAPKDTGSLRQAISASPCTEPLILLVLVTAMVNEYFCSGNAGTRPLRATRCKENKRDARSVPSGPCRQSSSPGRTAGGSPNLPGEPRAHLAPNRSWRRPKEEFGLKNVFDTFGKFRITASSVLPMSCRPPGELFLETGQQTHKCSRSVR